jgi:hypothetical protein
MIHTHRPRRSMEQECINPSRQIAVATVILMKATDICGYCEWNWLRFTLLVHRISVCLLDFLKMCAPLVKRNVTVKEDRSCA